MQPPNRGRGQWGPDWQCRFCLFSNFSSRQNCHKCQAPRPQAAFNRVAGNNKNPHTTFNQPLKNGNWICSKCNANNSTANQRCHRCSATNFQRSNASRGAFSGNRNSASGGYQARNSNHGSQTSNSSHNFGNSPHTKSDQYKECEILLGSLGNCKNFTQKIENNILLALPVWFKCWEHFSYHSQQNLEVLITSLAMLPSSCVQQAVPPITYCRMAVQEFFSNLNSSSKNEEREILILNKVEIVLNMVKKLMKVDWNEDKEIVKTGLGIILGAASSILNIQREDHRKISKLIYESLDSLDKPWVIKEKTTLKTVQESKSLVEAASEISMWQNVDVSWLANVKLFQPALLPMMKVPITNSHTNGVYEDPEEYFEIIQRLWIGLTFNDGNSTLNPKCRHKNGDKECGEVMLPNKQNGSSLFCSSSCYLPAILHCPDPRHKKGLCSNCAKKAKADLMGSAGPHASTNIYDCHVTRIDFEGRIYMDGVESRRPPYQTPIHWRSTRRLSSACLVGLVKLPIPKSPLKDTDNIIWGEIVNHGDVKDEYKRREEKRLCVSLATINDLNLSDHVKKDDYLAVIDCMTFVPEHIPVLKALDIQKLSILPFQRGALLNIGKHKDITNFELCTKELNSLMDELSLSGYNSILKMLVNLVIDRSQLDPIIRIKRDEMKVASLQKKLTKLVSDVTLDFKQLRSFAEALIEPVHLTQGPPGTGKSYLGVVIVRALLIIRKIWISVDPTVGKPPILVLSYKNHAIDEFLSDLVKAECSVNLIRIGDSLDSVLNRYSERNFRSMDSEVKDIKNYLNFLLKQKEDLQLKQTKLSPMFAYEACIHSQLQDENKVKAKKIASYNAAKFLHDLIVQNKKLSDFLNSQTDENLVDLNLIWNELMGSQTSSLTVSDIQNIWDGIKHYDEKLDLCEVILKWIEGVEPLPKCSFNNSDCRNIVCAKGFLLCHEHKCKFQQCKLVHLESHFLCEEHACHSTDCKLVKLPSPQIFCKEHACFICLKENSQAKISTDIPPRNTCLDHQLCIFVEKNDTCMNLASLNTSYCEDHKNNICSSKDCKKFALSRSEPYCENHKPQQVPLSQKILHCTAKNKKKKQCKAICKPGYEYCESHAKLYKASPIIEPVTEMNNQLNKTGPKDEITEEENYGLETVDKTNNHPLHNKPFSNLNETKQAGKKCIAKNKKKKKCKSICKPGYEYCESHAKLFKASPIIEPVTEMNNQSNKTDSKKEITQENNHGLETVDKLNLKVIDPNETLTAVNGPLITTTTSFDQALTEKKYSADITISNDNIVNVEEHRHEEPLPDELLDKIDQEEFIEESDNLQHMQEVYGFEELDDEELNAEELNAEECEREDISQTSSEESIKVKVLSAMLPPDKWTWEMSLEDRWYQCKLLEKTFNSSLSKLNELQNLKIKVLRKNHHEAKIKAKTRVYEGKSVIGGTIVGCIARLEAIRNTKPFAILVEEASEVLEPLVFSCLADTTCKLEMIGDHLQLKPSVMSKIMFERRNKINVSMFERLIMAPKGNSVPSSVLSIQRRMRKNICDLTRPFYEEIVDIEDHDICSSRKVGDNILAKWQMQRKFLTTNKLGKLSMCIGEGREVPGILPHIFFWTHEGVQTKAKVGLSRINATEAKMVVGLTQYLVSCGVPKTSIAILTPYKGQLMMMRSDLMKLNLLNNRDAENSVVLSTVDRFQGDEADIVIISLVIDAKSQTGFVKEVNRMIVLLSRARLGMYILGNISYFDKSNESIRHWTDTFTKLKQSCEPDTNQDKIKENVEELHYFGPRLGNKLPICCPIHRRKKMILVESETDLKLNFCEEKCLKLLPCTHSCNLLCHFQDEDIHNSCCSVVISPPPCEAHAKSLTCHNVFQSVGKYINLSIEEALKYYQCPETVNVQLPCMHTVQMKCWEENEIAEGKKSFPECRQMAYNPFTYSKCCHELKVLCVKYYELKNNPSKVKPCKVNVMYNPPCSHSVQVACYLKQQYEDNTVGFHCTQKLDILLPRCGHKANVSCDFAQTLTKWNGKSSMTGIVYEGQNYGPADFICKEHVDFMHKCHHVTKMECHLAFEQASKGALCTKSVEVTNPDCGHPATIPCFRMQSLKGILVPKHFVTEVKEGQTSLIFNNPTLQQKCLSEVILHRKCGHKEKLQCYQARDEHIQPCQASIEIENPICGHIIFLPCHLSKFENWQPWHQKGIIRPFFNNEFLSDDCPAPIFPSNPLLQYIRNCKKLIVVQRKSCGHQYNINCGVAFKELESKVSRKCEDLLKDAPMICGHYKTLDCSSYTHYKNHPEDFVCNEEIKMSCWNYKNCKNQVTSVCNKRRERVSCGELTNWICSKKHTISNVPICEKGFLSDCPKCKFEEAKELILMSEEALLKFFPKDLLSFKSVKLMNSSSLEEFLTNQNELINSLSVWLSKQTPLKCPLIEPKYIPCFILLNEHHLGLEKYPSKVLMKASTLNGIQVCQWTINNINKLISEVDVKKSSCVELLFGVALVCNTLVQIEAISKKKKILKKYANDIRGNGFDSLQFCENNWEYLIIWNPYAFLVTFKLNLQRSQLNLLNNKLSQSYPEMLNRKTFNPKYTQQIIPQDATSYVLAKTLKKSLNSNPINISGPDGLKFQKDWDGKSLGRVEIITKHVQNDLMNKLQFCMVVSGVSDTQRSVFSGLNVLKSLSELLKQDDLPEKHLLSSLEQCKLDAFDDAKAELDCYIEAIKRNKVLLHPLFLLAKARIAIHENKQNEGKTLLKEFSMFNSKAVKLWCEIHEKELINNDSDTTSKVIPIMTSSNNPVSKWNKLKDEEGVTSAGMDTLIKMTGLKKVKEFAIDLFKFSLKFAKLSPEAKSANSKALNFCFLGNAGSGKTTVARLLADILKDTGLRSAGTFVESSAQKLKDDGPNEFRKLTASAKNGILFIDEAYDLDPKGDSQGKPIVSELLVISENDREHLSIILAGYEDDMNEKLFSFNEGIKSRFEMVYFEDFDEAELKTIWKGEVEKRKFVCDDSVSTVVAKRLAKMSGRKGFGNARAVRKEVEKAIQVAMAREDFDASKMTLSIEDVVGESPLDNPKLKAILEEFDEKVGWQTIKTSVKELVEICRKNFTLQLMGKKTLPVMLNRLFLGNPGTGKTTCAKLYGRLLKELNFLSIGDVVMSTASDFVGSHVGESPKKTNAMLEKARGKVLVIDEAYNLNDKLYGKEVLDVLVEKVQNTESDDIAVLLLGYEPQIREMLRDQNPGLAQRFAMDYAFVFEDYKEPELFSILKSVCKKENIQLSLEVSEAILKLLEKQRAQANFGNAGAIDNVIRAALAKASTRPLTSKGMIKLIPSDICDGEVEKGSDPFAPLEKLYRVETIRQQLIEIRNVFNVAQAEGSKDCPELGHFVFQGAPGTGKTTVARVMAEILFDLGLLARKHVEETSGLGLTGEFLGQTKKRVKEKLDAARGGILFIDEAYELGKGHYGEEAITTLVAAMTDPNYKLVIIIAGYPKDMDQMLSRNVGLKSRFKRFINFEDWDSNDCIKFLEKKAKADNYDFDSDVKDCFYQGLEKLRLYPGWGNARDVVALWQKVLEHRANRVVQAPESKKCIFKSDALMALEGMIKDREPKAGKEDLNERMQSELNKFLQAQSEPDVMPAAQKVSKENIFEEVEQSKDVRKENHFPKQNVTDIKNDPDDARDPGVPDEIWRQLQLAKLAAKEEEQKKEIKKEEEKRLQEEQDNLLNELLRELQEEREEEKRQQMLLELKRKQEEERKRREAEEGRLREEQRKIQDIQNAIRKICPCPAGYSWFKEGGGWRCGGGSHFVSDEQLQRQFTSST